MPFTSAEWLEIHHRAKLEERRAFAEMLAEHQPKRVVDLGCGIGLWLEMLDEMLPLDSEFIGIDLDDRILELARERSRNWKRNVKFERLNLKAEPDAIPPSDMTLAFGLFPYLAEPAGLISAVADHGGTLVVRQCDGGALRFGPMDPRMRDSIEDSLRASLITSNEFRHYDMDRIFELLSMSPFKKRKIDFSIFARSTPFPKDFVAYYETMLNWTLSHLSESARSALELWIAESTGSDRYFFEVDLVGILS